MIVEDILTIRNVQGMESYKRDVEGLIRSALIEGGIEVLLSDVDERAIQLRGEMDHINEKFDYARQLEGDARGEMNDLAIEEMIELISSVDRLKMELSMIEITDPKLLRWKRLSEKNVEELSSEIEAGS